MARHPDLLISRFSGKADDTSHRDLPNHVAAKHYFVQNEGQYSLPAPPKLPSESRRSTEQIVSRTTAGHWHQNLTRENDGWLLARVLSGPASGLR
jgi:hypothetical protein